MSDSKYVELVYKDIEENTSYNNIINMVIDKCFEVENLLDLNLYISITLTTPSEIRTINNKYRNIDKETDVLSFPMFEKDELDNMIETRENEVMDTIGDIIISVDRVKEQSIEYGHSFERELAYMVVHGFYHLMGYDHMIEEDKIVMRKKEENVLNLLKISRDSE